MRVRDGETNDGSLSLFSLFKSVGARENINVHMCEILSVVSLEREKSLATGTLLSSPLLHFPEIEASSSRLLGGSVSIPAPLRPSWLPRGSYGAFRTRRRRSLAPRWRLEVYGSGFPCGTQECLQVLRVREALVHAVDAPVRRLRPQDSRSARQARSGTGAWWDRRTSGYWVTVEYRLRRRVSSAWSAASIITMAMSYAH